MNGRYYLSRASATTLMLLLALIASPIHCSGKSKNNRNAPPQTVYDQKQTGDYNIQLHLKDFQIIALLAGDEGGAGDYDYSYDYSDFTVKPVTQKPLNSTTGSTTLTVTTKPSPSSTLLSNSHPYPIVSPATLGSTSTTSSSSPRPNNSTTTKGSIIIDENKKSTPKLFEDSFFNEVEKINSSLAEMLFGKLPTTTAASQRIESTTKNEKLEQTMSPGKIKVQIIEAAPNLGIVPDEDSHEQSDAVPVAEGAAMLRRCASGFTRDKRGRCRRVRRPQTQLPFGFSRLASMAAKFRQSTAETPSSVESLEE